MAVRVVFVVCVLAVCCVSLVAAECRPSIHTALPAGAAYTPLCLGAKSTPVCSNFKSAVLCNVTNDPANIDPVQTLWCSWSNGVYTHCCVWSNQQAQCVPATTATDVVKCNGKVTYAPDTTCPADEQFLFNTIGNGQPLQVNNNNQGSVVQNSSFIGTVGSAMNSSYVNSTTNSSSVQQPSYVGNNSTGAPYSNVNATAFTNGSSSSYGNNTTVGQLNGNATVSGGFSSNSSIYQN
eukprot:GILJ01000949.1.p1 GENE.GILJ01000949.1~~GILJ01000949.1.p1  ORF type:complete len:249 (+),score=43.90 GILJ01000949.1:41-748(+)